MVERCSAILARAGDPFLRQILENDLLTLSEFFELARAMAALREKHEATVLSQEALQVSGRLITHHAPAEELGLAEYEIAF